MLGKSHKNLPFEKHYLYLLQNNNNGSTPYALPRVRSALKWLVAIVIILNLDRLRE
jgi:hypothetical protein